MTHNRNTYVSSHGADRRLFTSTPATGSNQISLGKVRDSAYQSEVSTLGINRLGVGHTSDPPESSRTSSKGEVLHGAIQNTKLCTTPNIEFNHVSQYSVGGVLLTYEIELVADQRGIEEEIAMPGSRPEFKKYGDDWFVIKMCPGVIKEVDKVNNTLIVWRGVTYGSGGIAKFSKSVRHAHMVMNKATKPLQDSGEPAEDDPLLNQFDNLTGRPEIILEHNFNHNPKAQAHIRLDSTSTVVPHKRNKQVGCLSPYMVEKILEAELRVMSKQAMLTLPHARRILLESAREATKMWQLQKTIDEDCERERNFLRNPSPLEASIDISLGILKAEEKGDESYDTHDEPESDHEISKSDHDRSDDSFGDQLINMQPRKGLESGLLSQLNGNNSQPSSNQSVQLHRPLLERHRNRARKRSLPPEEMAEAAREFKARRAKSGTGKSAFVNSPPSGPKAWREMDSSFHPPSTEHHTQM